MDDIDLLRDYAERNSEPGFAELVRRHINLVYSVALRFTANHEDAEDVTQAVFIILAQKAARLGQRTVLTGWLYETTRYTAMRLLRTRIRKQAREQEAYMQSSLNDSNVDGVWKQLAPLLEEAMARLSEKERTLLALRFFENRSGTEAAAILGVQEWAAHKRTARAVEKLRMFFTKRGMVIPSATLIAVISANSVHAAPPALAKTATAIALTKGTAASTSSLALVKSVLKVMTWTKAKAACVIGIVAILTVSTTTTWIVHHNGRANAQTDFPRSSWKNAGYADPVSAIETVFWATSQSDGKTIFASLSPNLQPKLEESAKRYGVSPVEFLSQAQNSAVHLDGIAGFHVVRLESVSDNEDRLHLLIDGKQGHQIFMMKKTGNEWKMDDFPSKFYGD